MNYQSIESRHQTHCAKGSDTIRRYRREIPGWRPSLWLDGGKKAILEEAKGQINQLQTTADLQSLGSTCSSKASVKVRRRSSWFLTKSCGWASSPFTEYVRTLQLECGITKLWSHFSDESSLGDARPHRIPIAGVTVIPKRRFIFAFSKLSWFPKHEELLAKPRTCKLLACVHAVQLGWGKKGFFLLRWSIELRPWLSKAKAWSPESFSAAKAVPWLLALNTGGVTAKSKAFRLIENSVKASWFYTSGRLICMTGSGTWLHSNNH